MTYIESIHGREVLDSHGNPTVEVEVSLMDYRLREFLVAEVFCLEGVFFCCGFPFSYFWLGLVRETKQIVFWDFVYFLMVNLDGVVHCG